MPLKWKDLVVTVTPTANAREWDMEIDGDQGVLRCLGGTDHTPVSLAAEVVEKSEMAELEAQLEEFLETISEPSFVDALKARFPKGVDLCDARLHAIGGATS